MNLLRNKLRIEMKESQHPLLYVSRPIFFGVDYSINPWMEGQIGKVDRSLAITQWKNLIKILRSLTEVRVISCNDPKLPDAVFIANAGSLLPDKEGKYYFIPSNFKYPERRGEQQFFLDALAWDEIPLAAERVWPPLVVFFEGDGDLLRFRDRLVVGYGFRTDREFVQTLWLDLDKTGDTIFPLELVDPRFYHLDTCFFYHNNKLEDLCMYYPGAFSDDSLLKLKQIIKTLRMDALEVTEEEALSMACNAIGIGKAVIGHYFSDRITKWLYDHDFFTMTTPLSEFHKAGGSAKCLTLRVPKDAIT